MRHAPVPVQSMLHGPVPQVRSLQLCDPLHVILHDLLLTQLTPLRHELGVEQAMLQLQPTGHVTCWLHAPPLSAQSIVHDFVALLHEVHCAGQLPAPSVTPESSWGATQKPSVHVRPVLQSDCFMQAKSSLRWFIEQLPAMMTANPMTANQSASFTACLPS